MYSLGSCSVLVRPPRIVRYPAGYKRYRGHLHHCGLVDDPRSRSDPLRETHRTP